MNVAELIEELKKCNQKSTVAIVHGQDLEKIFPISEINNKHLGLKNLVALIIEW